MEGTAVCGQSYHARKYRVFHCTVHQLFAVHDRIHAPNFDAQRSLHVRGSTCKNGIFQTPLFGTMSGRRSQRRNPVHEDLLDSEQRLFNHKRFLVPSAGIVNSCIGFVVRTSDGLCLIYFRCLVLRHRNALAWVTTPIAAAAAPRLLLCKVPEIKEPECSRCDGAHVQYSNNAVRRVSCH